VAAKTNALFEQRDYVTPEDIRAVAPHVLRHRIILNYEGKSEDLRTDDLVDRILSSVPVV